jgi:hypothetical protein
MEVLFLDLLIASYTSSRGIERFNGELSGSKIEVTNGQAFDQDEWSSLPGTGSGFIEVSLGATYQNISTSVKSQTLLDLDYNSDQLKPVNYNAVTYSISESQVNNYAAYTNPNNPFAQVQDYNYNLKRSIVPPIIHGHQVILLMVKLLQLIRLNINMLI